MKWKLENLNSPTAKRLYALGMQPNSDGFWVLHAAVAALREDPERLCATTKILYPDVARGLDLTAEAVQAHLRRTVKRVWASDANRAQLTPYLPARPGERCPTAAQFLAALLRWEAECIEADRAAE
jgi:hypothetical protein